MSAALPDAAHKLLAGANLAHVATLMAGGSPQTTPVWIDVEDGVPVFNTAKGRVKHRNLLRDPRVAFSVHNRDDPYEYVQVRGRAEMVDDPGGANIDHMSQKYTGGPYRHRRPGEERVVVRVIVEDVYYRGGN